MKRIRGAVRFRLPSEPVTRRAVERAVSEHGPLVTPWPLAFSQAMLRKLWGGGHGCDGLAQFVNAEKPEDTVGTFPLGSAWEGFRKALDALLDGKPAMEGYAVIAPLWLVGSKGVAYFSVQPPMASEHARPRDTPEAEWAERSSAAWMFALMLLSHPSLRRLLRRCAHCSRYDLLPRAKPGSRHFCTEPSWRGCRRAWEKSPAGRADAARRVREHRQRQPRGRRL